MTNLKATKEEHQKRREAFTKVKEYWAKNEKEVSEIREEIRELYNTIDRFEEQIAELKNKSSQYYEDNFKKYYPDSYTRVKETDTREEAFKKDEFWRGYNILEPNAFKS